jgi:hypothetical protein
MSGLTLAGLRRRAAAPEGDGERLAIDLYSRE